MAHWQIPMVVEFLQLQYIDRVIYVCCAAPAVRVQTWRSRSSSHSCNIDAGHVALMPVVASTGAWDGRDSAVHCGGSAVGSHRLACFVGPCTQVHGQGFPRHQGGEGVAGTPGACSQVFCHPIRCILWAYMDRHIRQTHRQNHNHHNHHTPPMAGPLVVAGRAQ